MLDAMQQDSGIQLRRLKVDGGATANNLLMQIQADTLGVSVQRPRVQETTALGAAYLAGLATAFWEDRSGIQRNWVLDREFTPQQSPQDVQSAHQEWQRAVGRSRDWLPS
ncbi:MAG: FGGY-family carbohydrate kinase [Planctomycetaceae bacterium]